MLQACSISFRLDFLGHIYFEMKKIVIKFLFFCEIEIGHRLKMKTFYFLLGRIHIFKKWTYFHFHLHFFGPTYLKMKNPFWVFSTGHLILNKKWKNWGQTSTHVKLIANFKKFKDGMNWMRNCLIRSLNMLLIGNVFENFKSG